MIAAFPRTPSLCAGETLELAIGSDVATTIAFARCGARLEPMREYAGTRLSAEPMTAGSAGTPWPWPVHRFQVPQNWRSGVYVALLNASAHDPVDARDARALFVVRSPQPATPVLYNLPLFTFHAYNVALAGSAEETCLYNNARAVTLARPGGGIGGHSWDEVITDVYDRTSPRQTFVHWDWPAIRWLEERFGAIDYCCDLDLHRNAKVLDGYELLVAFGHHEYWSDAMHSALTRHLRRGANAAFFTGNTAYFRIRYDDARAAISRIGRWDQTPEAATFGVSYRYGGGKWRGARPPSGFRVVNPAHWIYDGCTLEADDIFGANERLIGYECDGAPDECNARFEKLAQCSIAHWPVQDGSGELFSPARATLGINKDCGSLFVAGTVDWPRVLAASERTVERITANVIRRFAPSLV